MSRRRFADGIRGFWVGVGSNRCGRGFEGENGIGPKEVLGIVGWGENDTSTRGKGS